MKIEIETTELGSEYRCDELLIRGLAHTLSEVLDDLNRIKEPTAFVLRRLNITVRSVPLTEP
ncbi:MAG: hypothetical protein ACRERV_04825 [Methylococcales bacterium]